MYQRFDGYTWYIQAILNRMYEVEKKVETDKSLDGYLAKANGDVTPYIKTHPDLFQWFPM